MEQRERDVEMQNKMRDKKDNVKPPLSYDNTLFKPDGGILSKILSNYPKTSMPLTLHPNERKQIHGY